MPTLNVSPDIVTYNICLSVMRTASRINDAWMLLEEMKEMGVNPDTVSYNTVLSGNALCMCICMCVCVYVCMYVCMYAWMLPEEIKRWE